MTLQDLKDEWESRDRQLAEAIRLNAALLRETYLDKQRAEVMKRSPFGKFQFAIWIATLALLGAFIARHIAEPRFLIPALLLDGWTLAMGIAAIRQGRAMRELDFGEPPIVLQKKLEMLRIARLRTFRWGFLSGQVLWYVPFLIILFRALLGVDLYAVSEFMPRFMAWNVAGGLAFIPLAIWLSKRYGAGLERSTLGRHLLDSLAGRDVATAREFLARLARFEADAAPA
jgi:hypothetical protein